MNTDSGSTQIVVSDQPPEKKETQIHPHLQSQIENTTEPKPKTDIQALPQLHPAFGSQFRLHAPDVSAPKQPHVQEEAFQPDIRVRPEDVPLPDSPELQEIEKIGDPAELSQKDGYDNVTISPGIAPADLHASQASTTGPQPPPQAYLKEAPLPIPVSVPVPSIHNPPEQVAAVVSGSITNTESPPPSDAVSELQERAKLAALRVELMDTSIGILVETFKNKYLLDKELEKRCNKLIKASVVETTNQSLQEDLDILAKSIPWVQEQIGYLEECLREKHRNMQLAGPLIDARRERKKEEKQIKSIEKTARKIQLRAMKRDEAQIQKGKKESEAKMVADAWQQLPPGQ